MRDATDRLAEAHEELESPFVTPPPERGTARDPATGEAVWTGEEAETPNTEEYAAEAWEGGEQEGGDLEREGEGSGEALADELSLAQEVTTLDEQAAGASIQYPSGERLPIVSGPDASSSDEYWDPNRSTGLRNIPLVDTSAAQAAKRLSASFTVAELARSGSKRFDKSRLDPELVRCLQAIRDHVGKPVRVTSGYRSWHHNVRIYAPKKPTKSQHCSGRAADIAIAGLSGMEIAKAAIDASGPDIGVGVDRSYAHVDVRGRWARWTYPGLGDAAIRRRAEAELDEYRNRRATAAPGLGAVPTVFAASPLPAGSFLKDMPQVRDAALPPATPIAPNPTWSRARRALAETYNRLGGLMGQLAQRLGVEPAAVLAVWRVESGGRAHTPGKAIIRFENHLLFRLWGEGRSAVYDRHFRHGGRGSHPGKPWENHQFRESPDAPFVNVHTGKQSDEYRTLKVAVRLADERIALQCISIGGPQILVRNFRRLGYGSPREMYDAFQADERWHVLGFFDFCRTAPESNPGLLIRALRERDWERFSYYYNGKGQVPKYSGAIAAAYQEASSLPIVARELEPVVVPGMQPVRADAEFITESFAATPVEEWEGVDTGWSA